MATELRTDGNHLVYDDPSEDDDVHSFGMLDLYGDLDAYYIVQNLTGGKTISAVMTNYFNSSLTDKFRADFLLRSRFPGAGTKEELRAAVLSAYKSNTAIAALESSRWWELDRHELADRIGELDAMLQNPENPE